MKTKWFSSQSVLKGLAACLFFTPAMWAGQVAVGYISWDVNFPGNAGQFDITNLSGPNALPPSFPITTLVNLSSLSLKVTFVGGGSVTEGAGYFTLSPDGESFDGNAIPIGGTNPQPLSATLTGMFSPTSIMDPGPDSILPTFTVSFSDAPNLVDGDFGVIYATEGTVGTTTPEPRSWMLVSLGLFALLLARWRRASGSMKTLPLIFGFLMMAQLGFSQAVLPAYTTPSSGAAGIDNVNITASGIPAGTVTPANVIVSFENTCGGPAVMTEGSNSVRAILSVDRINFNIPAGLAAGPYFVQIADSADPVHFTSTDCSEVVNSKSTAVLNACVAGSSLGVLLPPKNAAGNVTAYVPKGWWGGSTTGVFVKNIEGALGAGSSIATAHVSSSCSSNPATGQTVCVANNTDVYLITGTTLNTTLTSSSTGAGSFSGGSCANCGVALNANNNTAAINMGLTGGSGSGIQILNLNTNTFNPALPLKIEVSENISVDPTRSLVLSASEAGNFTLAQIQADGVTLKEFDSSFAIGGESDSSAEDCSTGIGLSPQEFTNNVALVNLNSITFGATTYTAPNAVATLTTSAYSFSAGLSGSAVAQGSGHLAVVTGEFGGNTFAVLQLPGTPGTAVPALVDYAIGQIPANAACGGTFSAGYDPHTITAYTSPNDGNSYAVFAGYSPFTGVPICLAKVNMTTVINSALAPRGGVGYAAHEISPANLPASAVSFFTLP